MTEPAPSTQPAGTDRGPWQLETERLLLRPLVPADFEALYETVFGDPEVNWTGTVRPREEARTSLDDKLEHVRRHGFGMLAMVERATGEIVGYAGLQHLENGGDIEIGYYLGRRAWGRGLGTEVARELVRAAFEQLRLDRIVAVVRPENEASKRVLAKAGLHFVRRAHHYDADVELWAAHRADERARAASSTRPPTSHGRPLDA